jgi:hypothetical protein
LRTGISPPVHATVFNTMLSDRSVGLDSIPGYTDHDGGAAGGVHNESAFRYFLGIELRRAARSGHCVLLVLVSVRESNGGTVKLAPLAASTVFAALGASVREVDFVGWFREGRVAAAALVQRVDPSANARQQIVSRVMKTLSKGRLATAGSTRVRVVPLRGQR